MIYVAFSDSDSLKSAADMLDFPAPVLPTIPILSPGAMQRLTSLSTKSNSLRYLKFKFLISIYACGFGQFLGTLTSFCGFSLPFNSEYSKSLSTEDISLSA